MSFQFQKPPKQLIDQNGRPAFGVYAGAVPDVNLGDFPYMLLRRFPWTLSPNMAKWLVKKWQFVGVVDEEFVLGVAIVHLNYIGNMFAYVFDRTNNQLIEIKHIAPFCKDVQFSPSAVNGMSSYTTDTARVEFDNNIAGGARTVSIAGNPKLGCQISYREKGSGVTTVSRIGVYGFNHCFKMVAMPAKGEISYGGKTRKLSKKALAIIDWSTGTPQRETYWNWACGSGRDKQGRTIGINFACGMNETGYTENAFWVDGKPQKVDVVSFSYNQQNVFDPWRITSMDGKVDLTFHPDSERLGDENFGVVVSRLHQPFGRFTGTLQSGRNKYSVDNLYGFAEEHYAKW